MTKIRALLGGALLLVAGICFAEDQWPDSYSAGIGPDAQKEFAALPENGRAAYKTAPTSTEHTPSFLFSTDRACRTMPIRGKPPLRLYRKSKIGRAHV